MERKWVQVPSTFRPLASARSQGDPAELSAALPSLEELDLADNLVGDWAFVEGLLRALPALRALNLSRNRLALPPWAPLGAPPPAPPLQQPAQLPSLSVLVLNGCGVGWPQVVDVAQRLPSLRELHLCGNGIASLQLPASPASASASAGTAPTAADGGGGGSTQQHLAAAFPALGILDLEGNGLRDWGEVQLLGTLPALRALLLSGNALPSVAYSQGEPGFGTLFLDNKLCSAQRLQGRLHVGLPVVHPHAGPSRDCAAQQGCSGAGQ